MDTRTVDPSQGKLSVNGIPISGFADNIIEVEYDEDSFSTVVGADGKTTRIKVLNGNAVATIYLKQSSPSNLVLSLIADKDRADNTGIVPFLFTDLSGTTVISAAESWIIKKPQYSMGKEVKDESWRVQLVNATMNLGGNN